MFTTYGIIATIFCVLNVFYVGYLWNTSFPKDNVKTWIIDLIGTFLLMGLLISNYLWFFEDLK